MPIIVETQKVTLAGFRILVPRGVVIAGRNEVGQSLAHYRGSATGAAKDSIARFADSPARHNPAADLLDQPRRRRSRFSAMPVIVDNRVAGVIYTSRTPSNIFSIISTRSRKFHLRGLLSLRHCYHRGWWFSRTITRPMRDWSTVPPVSAGDRDAFRPLGITARANLPVVAQLPRHGRAIVRGGRITSLHLLHLTHD